MRFQGATSRFHSLLVCPSHCGAQPAGPVARLLPHSTHTRRKGAYGHCHTAAPTCTRKQRCESAPPAVTAASARPELHRVTRMVTCSGHPAAACQHRAPTPRPVSARAPRSVARTCKPMGDVATSEPCRFRRLIASCSGGSARARGPPQLGLQGGRKGACMHCKTQTPSGGSAGRRLSGQTR